METIYASLITLLFGAWVWELKGEVETMREGGRTAAGGDIPRNDAAQSNRSVSPRHAQSQAANPSHRPHPDVFSDPCPRVSRENGVPTWVIE